MTKKVIPDFKNIEDMARFWDKHDTTEFQHEEVEEVDYQPKRVVLSVRFDPEDAIAISRKARQLGMDRSTLVRFLVRQYLRQDDQAASTEYIVSE